MGVVGVLHEAEAAVGHGDFDGKIVFGCKAHAPVDRDAGAQPSALNRPSPLNPHPRCHPGGYAAEKQIPISLTLTPAAVAAKKQIPISSLLASRLRHDLVV